MTATDLISLLGILRTLVARKAELDKAYFDQFIRPAWDAFVKVHEDYKRSFRRYVDLASQKDYPIENLIEQIRQDSIFTADLRTELSKLIKYLPSAHAKTKEDYLSDFAFAVVKYFSIQECLYIEMLPEEKEARLMFFDSIGDNRPRYAAIIYLSRKGNESGREDAKKMFNGIAQDLQRRYEEVSDAYFQLRKDLLS
jgi:hypothetical protein